MSKLVTVTQIMERFHVEARSTIYRWIKEGKLPPPTKNWGSPMWDGDKLERFLAEKDAKAKLFVAE